MNFSALIFEEFTYLHEMMARGEYVLKGHQTQTHFCWAQDVDQGWIIMFKRICIDSLYGQIKL